MRTAEGRKHEHQNRRGRQPYGRAVQGVAAAMGAAERRGMSNTKNQSSQSMSARVFLEDPVKENVGKSKMNWN